MSLRVLIVDDGPAAEALAHRFVQQGCRVSLAAGPTQALAALKRNEVDVTVADAGSAAELMARGDGAARRLILTVAGPLEVVHHPLDARDYIALSSGASLLYMDERVDPSCHFTQVLESAGHKVVRGDAPGAAEARPDLAFLDAGLAGWRTWLRLRAARGDVRAVMPAGPCAEHVAARLARGDAPVVGKELSPKDMESLVGVCLKSSARNASILLVDDDGPFREAIADFLRGEGFHADEEGTAGRGVERAKAGDYDVIVSDYHLPDFSGVQLIERLAEAGAGAKIIMLTGEPDLDSALQAVRMRVQAYLSKPVSPEALLAAIDRALRERRLEGQVKELIGELSRANARLEDFDRMKTRFLFLVAHDIRSPLSGAKGFTDFLRMKHQDMPAPVKDGLATVSHALDQVNLLVEDILDLSRMESGKLKVAPVAMDVGKTAAALKERFEVLAREAEVALAFTADKAPASIVADPLRVDQVISNLAGNALKHAGRGRHVAVTLSADETGGLAVDVADDGPGLKPEELSRVFDPYYQGDDPMSLKKGVGLGLAIVRELVEAHGGRVWAESEGEGKGCTFRVRLPAHPPAAPEGEVKRRSP